MTRATTTENMQTTSGLVITAGNSAAILPDRRHRRWNVVSSQWHDEDQQWRLHHPGRRRGRTEIHADDRVDHVRQFSASQGSTTSTAGGLTGSVQTVAIAVTLSTPNVTNASTLKNTQTTSGLIITPGPHDSRRPSSKSLRLPAERSFRRTAPHRSPTAASSPWPRARRD